MVMIYASAWKLFSVKDINYNGAAAVFADHSCALSVAETILMRRSGWRRCRDGDEE